MLKTADLLALASSRHEGASDYRIAKLLGIPAATVSSWRIGRTLPAAPLAARLGALCGLDPDAVVCWVNLERSATDSERETWLSILHRVEHSPRAELAA